MEDNIYLILWFTQFYYYARNQNYEHTHTNK